MDTKCLPGSRYKDKDGKFEKMMSPNLVERVVSGDLRIEKGGGTPGRDGDVHGHRRVHGAEREAGPRGGGGTPQ